MSEQFLFLITSFAIETENIAGEAYRLIRQSPPYNFLLFYAVFFYVLYRVFTNFTRKKKVFTYKIIDEHDEAVVAKTLNQKNKEIAEFLESIGSDNTKSVDYSKKLESVKQEVALIQSLYNEFQSEILDSYREISSSLKPPFMK